MQHVRRGNQIFQPDVDEGSSARCTAYQPAVANSKVRYAFVSPPAMGRASLLEAFRRRIREVPGARLDFCELPCGPLDKIRRKLVNKPNRDGIRCTAATSSNTPRGCRLRLGLRTREGIQILMNTKVCVRSCYLVLAGFVMRL